LLWWFYLSTAYGTPPVRARGVAVIIPLGPFAIPCKSFRKRMR
jgi:hypothetical protein